MKLALHIGTARTGTTSLQVWFSGNRASLAEQGICYPAGFGNETHRALAVYALENVSAEPIFSVSGVRSPDDHQAFRDKLQADLGREIESTRARGYRAWVMSSELLHSKVNTPRSLERLHALLMPLFDEITVYLHLRPQVDLLISNTTQRARSGRAVNRAELTRSSVSSKSSYFNYNKIVGYWEDVFGPQNLRLIPYRRIPDMTAVLARDLQIDMSRLPPVERLNPGLGWRSLALANVFHAGFSALNLGVPPNLHLDELPGHDRLQMGLLVAQEVQSRFDASNAKLVKRRNDISVEDLTPDWSAMDEVGNLHLVEAPSLFSEQLAQMVRRLAQEQAMERWRRHIAEGRLAALTGDMPGLESAKHFAEEAAADLDGLGSAQQDELDVSENGMDVSDT